MYMYYINGLSSVIAELEQNSIKLKPPTTLQHSLPITPNSFNQLVRKFEFI